MSGHTCARYARHYSPASETATGDNMENRIEARRALSEFVSARLDEAEGPRRWWKRRSALRKTADFFSEQPVPAIYRGYVTPQSAEHALKLLADRWHSHPDWREEWNPSQWYKHVSPTAFGLPPGWKP